MGFIKENYIYIAVLSILIFGSLVIFAIFKYRSNFYLLYHHKYSLFGYVPSTLPDKFSYSFALHNVIF